MVAARAGQLARGAVHAPGRASCTTSGLPSPPRRPAARREGGPRLRRTVEELSGRTAASRSGGRRVSAAESAGLVARVLRGERADGDPRPQRVEVPRRQRVGAGAPDAVGRRVAPAATAELRRYRSDRVRFREPVVLYIGLVSRSCILDLTATQSMVRSLLDAGLDVYVLDWGTAGPGDAHKHARDVRGALPAARAACRPRRLGRRAGLDGRLLHGREPGAAGSPRRICPCAAW
jgi:hypothetical protein